MFKAVDSPYLVPFDGSFDLEAAPQGPPGDAPGRKELKERLQESVEQLEDLQRKLYAEDSWALLTVFQAMDAGGKDSTIRKVFSGVNPAGFQVSSFKRPSAEELDHDFLWRTTRRLPERGRIGVFNRSYYEEVLVVRVHPGILDGQRIPRTLIGPDVWEQRLEDIRHHELHLARSGTAVVKFWLNVSKEEQRRRFLARIDRPEKNWKFSESDIEERAFWDDYRKAYQDAVGQASRPWAPWYAIPADSKPYMRMVVADILVRTLESLDVQYPQVSAERRAELQAMRHQLEEPGQRQRAEAPEAPGSSQNPV